HAACAGARRGRQGPAPIDARDMRSCRAHRPAGRDQEPERVERNGARALCGEPEVERLLKMRNGGLSPAARVPLILNLYSALAFAPLPCLRNRRMLMRSGPRMVTSASA